MSRPLTLKEAQARYVHRFTCDNVPGWARQKQVSETGQPRYYAPQYASDAEWFEITRFPGEAGIDPRESHCQSGPPTWPHGSWLAECYQPGVVPVPFVDEGWRHYPVTYTVEGSTGAWGSTACGPDIETALASWKAENPNALSPAIFNPDHLSENSAIWHLQELLENMESPRSRKASRVWDAARQYVLKESSR